MKSWDKLCKAAFLTWRVPDYYDVKDILICVVTLHEDKATVGEESLTRCLFGDAILI